MSKWRDLLCFRVCNRWPIHCSWNCYFHPSSGRSLVVWVRASGLWGSGGRHRRQKPEADTSSNTSCARFQTFCHFRISPHPPPTHDHQPKPTSLSRHNKFPWSFSTKSHPFPLLVTEISFLHVVLLSLTIHMFAANVGRQILKGDAVSKPNTRQT